jgi:hypothetical protein
MSVRMVLRSKIVSRTSDFIKKVVLDKKFLQNFTRTDTFLELETK